MHEDELNLELNSIFDRGFWVRWCQVQTNPIFKIPAVLTFDQYIDGVDQVLTERSDFETDELDANCVV